MKSLSIYVLLFFLSFFGTAHAENVYDMKYQGYLIKENSGGPSSSEFYDPIPIAEISNDNLTFSGDARLIFDDPSTLTPATCCSVNLGNQGGFTVIFDNPVNSVGLDIFPSPPGDPSALEQLYRSTVSAVYKNSEGEVVGQSSVTANWLGEVYGPWQWNNTFNGHEGAFGVSSVEGFSEITFSVDGMEANLTARGFSYVGPLSIGSTKLYYSYLNPVPEPETYAMLLSGLGLLGFMVKRRKKSGRNATSNNSQD